MARVDELCDAGPACGDGAGSERHAAVRDGRTLHHDEHSPARDRRSGFEGHRRLSHDDARSQVDRPHVRGDLLDRMRIRRIDLVDDDDICHPQVGLAWVVGQLVTGPERIGDGDEQVGGVEREVVVPPVPDDDVRLLLGPAKDVKVVNARIHDHAHAYGASYSSRPSIVGCDAGCDASMSATVAKRWTRIRSRSPYGIGWRTMATRIPRRAGSARSDGWFGSCRTRSGQHSPRRRASCCAASSPSAP
jgi:hypothetical protein